MDGLHIKNVTLNRPLASLSNCLVVLLPWMTILFHRVISEYYRKPPLGHFDGVFDPVP